jgi:putative phosphoribosyl transferase
MPTDLPAAPVPRTVEVPTAYVSLVGDLAVPRGARGLVLFAHTSGSNRRSPLQPQVAAALQTPASARC